MTELFLNGRVTLHCGDCLEVLTTLPECSVDSVVTDPPYHLTSIVKRMSAPNAAPVGFASDGRYQRLSGGFMGKVWDGGSIAFEPATWAEVLRVLKPGGHLLAFGGTRTFARMSVAIEDAGFEVRDTIMWVYGSGFPKSHDVSKGIDRAAGAERKVLGEGPFSSRRVSPNGGRTTGSFEHDGQPITAPATPDAAQWEGWGTAAKPSHEPITFCTKPLPLEAVFAILIHNLTERMWVKCQSYRSPAKDAESDLKSILLKCERAGENTVVAHAKTSVLENPERAVIAAASSMLHERTLKRAMEYSVPETAKEDGSGITFRATATQTTRAGATSLAPVISELLSDLTNIGWNTFSLWKAISEGVLDEAKTYTTETAIEQTTALRTLNCLLLQNTQDDTPRFVPNLNPIVLARKPLSESTVAKNVLRWGTGAINVGACRVATDELANKVWRNGSQRVSSGNAAVGGHDFHYSNGEVRGNAAGRWPANLIHDGSEEVVATFPETASGARKAGEYQPLGFYGNAIASRPDGMQRGMPALEGDSGSAARFFYTAKADADDRLGSRHPTVKPVDLMQYLVRLVTPKGGVVLDPFAGTGTTGEAAWREGMRAVLIEAEAEYQADVRRRMEFALAGPDEKAHAIVKAKGLTESPGPLFDVIGYDAHKDVEASFTEAYRVIRARKAAGGPGWEPK